MYRKGVLPEPPDGISREEFRKYVRRWMRIEEAQGPDALRHKVTNKVWKLEEKLFLVSKVIVGESNKSVALNAGINDGILYQWVRNYKI